MERVLKETAMKLSNLDFYGSPQNEALDSQYSAKLADLLKKRGSSGTNDQYGTFAPEGSLYDNLPRIYGGQAPLNTLVNNQTGASYQFAPQPAPWGNAPLDYASPINVMGRKGFPLKGDATTVVFEDGSRAQLGVDRAATQSARDADMKRQIAQADLEAKQIANRNNQVSIEDRALQEQRGKLRAQNEVWQSLPPKMRDAEEARRLGIKLEKGQQYNSDTGQVETLRGSKLGMKIQEDRQELVNGTIALKKEYDSARDRIAKILGNPNWESAVGWIQGNIPMTLNLQDRATVASNIKNLAEQLQVQGLKNLRQGGVAPGSITEKEWSKFVAGFGNLDPTQDEKSFKNELQGLLQRLDSAEASREGLLKEFDSRYVWTDKDRRGESNDSMNDWVNRAKQLNPGMSEAEIVAEYYKKFRR